MRHPAGFTPEPADPAIGRGTLAITASAGTRTGTPGPPASRPKEPAANQAGENAKSENVPLYPKESVQRHILPETGGLVGLGVGGYLGGQV